MLAVISLSFWYDTKRPRFLKVFICVIILLFITILLLTGSTIACLLTYLLTPWSRIPLGQLTCF